MSVKQGKSMGVGKWDGVRLEWLRSEDDEAPTMLYINNATDMSFSYSKGEFPEESMPEYVWRDNTLVAMNGEGEYTLQGSFPHPAAILAVLFYKLL